MAQSSSTLPTKSPAISNRQEMSENSESELSLDDDIDDEEHSRANLEKYVKGARVEVKIKNKWRTGVIVNRADDNVLVKFDERPRDKFDMKINVNSDFLKLVAQPVEIEIQHRELISNSTATQITNQQLIDRLSRGYRLCLHHVLSSSGSGMMDSNAFNTFTPNDLANFPMEELIVKCNENGLSDEVIDRIRSDYEELTRELERKNIELEIERGETKKCRNNLCHHYQLIARLIRTIYGDMDLDPVTDGDTLQELLEGHVSVHEDAQDEAPGIQIF